MRRRTTWRRRGWRIRLVPSLMIAGAAALSVLSVTSSAALAASSSSAPDVTITQVKSSGFPNVQVAFTKRDDDPSVPSFTITENGQKVSDVQTFAGSIGETATTSAPVLMLAIDASQSMAGTKLAAAKAAAMSLLGQVRSSDRVGLVVFNQTAQVLVQPTTDMAQLQTAINGIHTAYGTVLYDAIADATKAFPSDATSKDIVLLTDGAENHSTISQAQAVEDAASAGVSVYTVGLPGKGFNRSELQAIASGTGGQYHEVTDVHTLNTLYAQLGQQLLHAYWLTYQSTQPAGKPVTVTFSAAGLGTQTAHYSAPAQQLPGNVTAPPPKTVKTSGPAIPLPGGTLGRMIAAAPFAVLFMFLALQWFGRRGRRRLDNLVAPYTAAIEDRSASSADPARGSARTMLTPLFSVTDQLLSGSALFGHLRFLIEQANMPLRAVELLYVSVVSAFLGGVLIGLVAHSLIALLVGLPITGLAPYLWVRLKARKRRRLFEDQLADVLSGVASSLRAGHSFNQSLNAIVKDAPEPTAHEFQRVMAEVSLGLPIDDALSTMADRMSSADFDFAVTTVNIQRTVGGSMSEILEMVSDTIRGRQQFRKKVKALTSMGTASAYVLLAMPIFMAVILTFMNPAYMAPLIHSHAGHLMLVAGCVLMALGYVSCKKIVNIKT